MKSGKQRRAEIKQARLKRAQKNNPRTSTYKLPIPKHAIKANSHLLVTVSMPYWVKFPLYYVDEPFTCKRCGVVEVWTAKQQRWWYEVIRSPIESIAIHCRACRLGIKEEKRLQKQHMADMANKKPHPNDAFFKKRYIHQKGNED